MTTRTTLRRVNAKTKSLLTNALAIFGSSPAVRIPARTRETKSSKEAVDAIGLKFFPSDYTALYVVTERQANECLQHITQGDVGFDTEFTKRRPTAEEQYIDEAFPTGSAARKSAMLGWQIVEFRTGAFAVAWDNIGLRLIQVAHENNVWVLDMWKIKAIPSELLRILACPDIKKGGVALSNDILVIWDDLRVEMANLVDVGLMAKLALIDKHPSVPFTNLSLKVSVEDILGFEIEKEIAKSDWSANILSEDQIQYAALDAIASLRLLKALGPLLQQKSDEIGACIPPAWYTFNTRRGEATRTKLSSAGEVVPWRQGDCTWFAGGKYIGPP